MKQILLLLLSIFSILNTIQSQDTIPLEKPSKYFAQEDTIDILSVKRKNIYSKAKYSKELIQFSSNKGKIEYCFYHDNKRFKKQYEVGFYLKDDTISINVGSFSEDWIYTKIDNKLYKIFREIGSIREIGYARSLIPLEKTGSFHVINIDNDTLYSFQYEDYIISKTIKINTQFSNKTAKNLCSLDKSNSIHDYFKQAIKETYTIPRFDSRITSLVILKFSILDNGQINNINIRNTHNPFFKKAVLNVFGKKELYKITSKYSNCTIQLVLKEPFQD